MKPSYEELEKKCALQQSKLAAINELMNVVEKASDIAKAGIEELQSQNADMAVQLANAESKCRELAAENGQMLRLLTDISENHDEYVNADEYLYAGVPMDYVSEINTYVSRDVDAENPFKATDSFLAEVRAQGVERMIEVKQQQLDGMHPDTFAIGAVWDSIRRDIYELKVFAEILRQEAAQ
ncbi:hypothetical protein [Citrobacter sp. Igbk 17]|uniref:hypothetical protein n=1 Tax=Citrobacter sp. Igbk 17 TaxID=2963957 RepID=UPI002302CA78|nr:hypothetical protein [Citrobacter sp. Igbk 17]MDA8498748.1 hypothetical protein [Citrobacter sp. Igbk 17]